MSQYEKAWQAVRARIAAAATAANRDPAAIVLVAVSKTFPAAAVRAVYQLGQRVFGENYVQEAAQKREALADLADLHWRLIGPLQSNKARLAARIFSAVETVDRISIAERLSRECVATSRTLDVLVQVNVSGEASKSGVPPHEAPILAHAIAGLPGLRVRGIMGLPEPTSDASRQRAQLRALRDCYDACRPAGPDVDTLSMGMSADLEAAIVEGATEVRVGSAIFGERHQ